MSPTSSSSSSPPRMSLSRMSRLWQSGGWQGWGQRKGVTGHPRVPTWSPSTVGDGRPPPCPHLEPQQGRRQQPQQLQDLAEQLVPAQHDPGEAGGGPQDRQHLQQQGTDGTG